MAGHAFSRMATQERSALAGTDEVRAVGTGGSAAIDDETTAKLARTNARNVRAIRRPRRRARSNGENWEIRFMKLTPQDSEENK